VRNPPLAEDFGIETDPMYPRSGGVGECGRRGEEAESDRDPLAIPSTIFLTGIKVG